MNVSPRLGLGLALLLMGLLHFGCSHYRLGTGAALAFETLYIAPVSNPADVPQAVALVTGELRETFLRDGRVRLVNTPDEADAILSVALVSYQRGLLTANPADTARARKMGVTLTARATLALTDRSAPLFEDRLIRAERQLFTDGNRQLQAEYQLLPLLAETLAAQARAAVLDTW